MRSIFEKANKLIQSHRIIVLSICCVVLYSPLLKAYFQQDEWLAFGYYSSNISEGLFHLLKLAFAPNIGHFTPLYYLSFYLLMSLFGVNYSAFFITSVIWHLVIFALLYKTIKVLTSNEKIALLTSTLFLFSASASQATTWVVADTNTHGATFFGLLALFLATSYLVKKTELKSVVLSVLFIFVSLFFKEVTIGLFVSILVLVFVLDTSVVKRKIILISTAFSGIFYIILRAVMILLPKSTAAAPLITQSQTMGLLIYNAVTFPAKAFFQAFLPIPFWLQIGRTIGRILPHRWAVNTSQFSTSVNEKILEPLFIISFIGICLFTYKRYRRNKTLDSKIMVWALFFVIVNSVIYAFSPERTGIITFLDSRNLYFTSIGSFLWLAALIYKRLQNKNIIALGIISVLMILQLSFLRSQFTDLVQVGELRQTILNQIMTKVPSLPENATFYIESDTPYYGLSSEKTTPPFQSGFGHTLLVLYTKATPYPVDFYSESFLWPLASEGYLTRGGKSFGYYSKYQTLLSDVKKYNIPVETIYAFSWQGGTNSIIETTKSVRINLNVEKNL